MSLRAATMHGMLWTGVSFGSRFFFQLAVSAILARILAPTDFGLVAMSAIVVNFLLLFRSAGLAAALQQRREVTADHFNAVFWYGLGSGSLIALLVALLAPAIALLYGEPRLVPVVALSGLTILVNSASGAHSGILARDLRFRTMGLAEIASQVLAGIAAVLLAYSGLGVYALVLQGILSGIFTTVFLWAVARWRPSFSFQSAALRELWGFGAHITGFQVVNYLYRNLDAFLVGRFLGTMSLAFYRQAYAAMRLPTQMIHQTISRVLFPALSRIEDVGGFRLAYLESVRLLAAFLFFPFAAMVVLAAPFVLALYGPNWTESILLVRLFALAGFVDVLSATTGWIFKSRGRPDLQMRLALLLYPVSIAAVIVGLRWGTLGVALAYVGVNYLVVSIWPAAFRLAGLTLAAVLRALAGVILATVIAMAWMLGGLLLALSGGLHNPFLLLACVGSLGALVYVAVLWVADRRLLREARASLRHLGAAAPVVPT